MLRLAVGILSVMVVAGVASGQNYPTRPIRIVTSSPGGSGDFISRLMSQEVSSGLGQQIVVENRATNLTGGILARAQPDGYTLLVAGSGTAFAPLFSKVDFDSVKDFAAITRLASAPNILIVHPSLAVNSVSDLIALAKAKPGVLNYGSGPLGSSYHLAAELFKSMAGVNLVRIPYAGGTQSVTGLLGGQLQVVFGTTVAVAPHIKSGKVKALAHTGSKPSTLAPGLPTIASSGLPGYELVAVDFMVAPAKTPAPIIKRLNQEVVRFLSRADIKEKILSLGEESDPSTPEEFAASMKADIAKVAKLMKDAGIKPE